jgi:hypothetical protein
MVRMRRFLSMCVDTSYRYFMSLISAMKSPITPTPTPAPTPAPKFAPPLHYNELIG